MVFLQPLFFIAVLAFKVLSSFPRLNWISQNMLTLSRKGKVVHGLFSNIWDSHSNFIASWNNFCFLAANPDDVRKLWKNVEPHLKSALQTVYLREISRLSFTSVSFVLYFFLSNSTQWERLQAQSMKGDKTGQMSGMLPSIFL
jgi:hypothetical protein